MTKPFILLQWKSLTFKWRRTCLLSSYSKIYIFCIVTRMGRARLDCEILREKTNFKESHQVSNSVSSQLRRRNQKTFLKHESVLLQHRRHPKDLRRQQFTGKIWCEPNSAWHPEAPSFQVYSWSKYTFESQACKHVGWYSLQNNAHYVNFVIKRFFFLFIAFTRIGSEEAWHIRREGDA